MANNNKKCSKKIRVDFEGVLSLEDGEILLEVEDYGILNISEKIAFMDGEKVKISFNVSEEI